MIEFFIELLKFTLPALVVFLTSYMLLKYYLDSEYKRRLLRFRESNQKTVLPLRLQAYERLTLFLERISPTSLIHRVQKPNMTAHEFHLALLNNIRMEYEHNLSQQLYITPDSWELIKAVKEEVINIINNASAEVSPDDKARALSKAIFERLISSEQMLPTQKALNTLKQEVQQLY